MGGVLLGFALGAMTFTSRGRDVGNKLGEAALAHTKKVIAHAKESAEQPAGAFGDHRDSG